MKTFKVIVLVCQLERTTGLNLALIIIFESESAVVHISAIRRVMVSVVYVKNVQYFFLFARKMYQFIGIFLNNYLCIPRSFST